MKHQLNSFKVALKGINYAIKNEGHMRFHLVAAFYVLLFGFFYSFSKLQWAILLLLICCVLMAEIFNTSLENLCDLNTDSYNPMAKIAKDTAAGAVLILCICAVVVAFLFYFDLEVIKSIFVFFITNPILLILLVLSVVISIIFIALGPNGIKNLFHKTKVKK